MRYLTTREVSALTGYSESWLKAARSRGYGPPYCKDRGAVRYREDDVHAYMANHRVCPSDNPHTQSDCSRFQVV